MRKHGVAVPKYELKNQVDWQGNLMILDGRDEGLNRTVKTARLALDGSGERRIEVLFEPHIVWMNEDRFTLQGFERVLQEGKIVEYAQSWLCEVTPEQR